MRVVLRMWLVVLAVCSSMGWQLASASAGVKPDYRMVPRIFTADDGLPASGVTAIVQTRDGYLWVGTFGGLARFDGAQFTTFRGQVTPDSPVQEGGRHAGPPSDRILALHEDDAGRLWIGTEDAGLSVLEQGAFRHLQVCGGVCEVNDILQGPDRGLWIASNVGLFKLDPDSLQETWGSRSQRGGYNRLAADGQGRIHAGGYAGFHVVTDQGLQAIPLPDGDRLVRLLKATGEGLLVGTEQELYRYETALAQWQLLDVEGPAYAARGPDGRWWVSRASGQLMREGDDGEWRNVPELSGMGITSLSWDGEGNLWIGSGSKGLLRVRESLFGLFSAPQLGTTMAGRAVISDGRGGLWLGSACGGLYHWSHDASIRKLAIRQPPRRDCVISLLLDSRDALWAGMDGGRLVRIVDGAVESIDPDGMVAPVNVWEEDEGRYLVGSGRSTLELETDAEGRIRGRHRIEALQGMKINSTVPAVRGGRWFVGDQGALRLVDGDVVERWTPREGLSSRFARALYEDEETDTLWIGTYGGGLNRIRNGRISRYDDRNGLFDDTVSCILPDAQGRLWLGGNRGVTLLPAPREAGEEIESIGYTAIDGLAPAEINGGTSSPCHRDVRGRLWFSLVEGFAVVDPADVPEGRPAPPRPHIEYVAVAGDRQEIEGATLVLPPSARNLEIRYTAINLSRPRETHFRFRLSGFDRDWMEAGQNRSIVYPSVPWGEHLFEVQARTEGGPWSPVAASLRISHPQPWYQRPWIWALTTLLVLVVLVGSTQFGSAQFGSTQFGSTQLGSAPPGKD